MSILLNIPGFVREYDKSITAASGRIIPNCNKRTYKHPDEIVNWLMANDVSLREVHAIIHNNLPGIPTCKVCGKRIQIGKTYCSSKCSNADPDVKAKMVANIKKTSMEKYGVDNPFKAAEVKEKIKKTNLERYGNEHARSSVSCREKAKATWLKNYGVDHPLKCKSVIDKMQNTNLDKYGSVCALHNDDIAEKVRQTNLERRGVEYPTQNSDVREKVKQTNINRYGVENPLMSSEIKERMKQTCLEKYGCEYNFQRDDIKTKIQESHRSNYYNRAVKLLRTKHIAVETSQDEYAHGNYVNYRCLKCNCLFESDTRTAQKIHCPTCAEQYGTSQPEYDVYDFVKSVYTGEIKRHDRTVISPLELDIYIPEKKLAIEFNGNYWHSTEKKSPAYHQEKTLACREKGIHLIHIFEYEWDNKREKIENIIRAALGIFDHRLYARKCITRPIDAKTYREFLDDNHLQGAINSPIRFGLFNDGVLVSVIGFGKSRFKKDEIELHRYCVKANYQIIGGFGKLIHDSGQNKFTSYIDLAHFDGRGYSAVGFTILDTTKPNYCWVRDDMVLNRMSAQKHKLPELLKEDFIPELTEKENMELAGYYQIFDAGNLKVEFNAGAAERKSMSR